VGADNSVTAVDLVSSAGPGKIKFGIWLREDHTLRHRRYPCRDHSPIWQCSASSTGLPWMPGRTRRRGGGDPVLGGKAPSRCSWHGRTFAVGTSSVELGPGRSVKAHADAVGPRPQDPAGGVSGVVRRCREVLLATQDCHRKVQSCGLPQWCSGATILSRICTCISTCISLSRPVVLGYSILPSACAGVCTASELGTRASSCGCCSWGS
jgi:hypothetical protein